MLNPDSNAVKLALASAGVFFLSGLLTGVWKYAHMARTPAAQAPAYIDIAHRAALFYSFAALLIAVFAGLSAWSETVNFWAAAAPLAFFALAIGGYVLHGLLGDTDNQFRRPHRVGAIALPRHGLLVFMVALCVAEIGGFLVLFAGLLRSFGWV
ncbi:MULTISPECIES: hypothetical protein [Hydrocarboniphaga]|uniref:Integral membrane protein n=1 Tax=Hydrocarboniphaga effusa AP103 TaxID=1172194 RepID=I8TCR8_9GAMM|nr:MULTISPECIES: hypothetical protein [Hydrocarboniphaga]EIT71770.1 hypothetical protein WQQ_19070 [Hydrocarboniphaga effusa AP103]MDZ4080393.1 hypothetical protein [Hydrocarboniphaga sp.]